jgi:hypothetical protein
MKAFRLRKTVGSSALFPVRTLTAATVTALFGRAFAVGGSPGVPPDHAGTRRSIVQGECCFIGHPCGDVRGLFARLVPLKRCRALVGPSEFFW